jgi:hypothetical protein
MHSCLVVAYPDSQPTLATHSGHSGFWKADFKVERQSRTVPNFTTLFEIKLYDLAFSIFHDAK